LVHAVEQSRNSSSCWVTVAGEQVGPGGGHALVVGAEGGQSFGERVDDHAAGYLATAVVTGMGLDHPACRRLLGQQQPATS
jgi:hypothetical protein